MVEITAQEGEELGCYHCSEEFESLKGYSDGMGSYVPICDDCLKKLNDDIDKPKKGR